MKRRFWLALCIALSLIGGEFAAARPAPILASAATALPTPHLSLLNAPAIMLAGQTGVMKATLDQPVNDGAITFTETSGSFSPGQPAQPLAVYSCATVNGSCSMTWSTPPGFVGKVAIGAVWSGDARFSPVSTTRGVAIAKARYTYIGFWRGASLEPMTQVVPTPAIPPDARPAGYILHFRTLDPMYRCMNGESAEVFTTGQFPVEYMVYHHAGAGADCAAGAWLVPQAPAVSGVTPLAVRAGTRITLRGSFPADRPFDVAVQVLGIEVRTVPVLSWSPTAVTVAVPEDLFTGRYTLTLIWHDHFTGTAVDSAATPARLQVTGPSLPPEVAPNTRVPDPETLADLISKPSASVLTFRTRTPFLAGLKPGDIIAAGVSHTTPDGLLRKVVSIENGGAGISLSTAPATLRDAVKQGSFDVHATLASQNVESFTPLQRGVSMVRTYQPNGPFCIPINNVTLFDNGYGSTVVANGSVCLSADVELAGYLNGHGAAESAMVTASDTAHIRLTATVSASISKTIELASLQFGSITFYIGYLPVVITPELSVSIGASGKISVSTTVGATQNATINGGAGCSLVWFPPRASCQGYPASVSNTFTPDPVVMQDTAQIRVFAPLDFKALLYGQDNLALADLQLQAYLELDASTAVDPWWTLYAGIQLNLGLDLDLFVFDFNPSFTLADDRVAVAQATGPFPGLKTGVALSVSPATSNCRYLRPYVSACDKFILTATVTNSLGPVSAQVAFTENGNPIASCPTDPNTGACTVYWTPDNPGVPTTAQMVAYLLLGSVSSAPFGASIHGVPPPAHLQVSVTPDPMPLDKTVMMTITALDADSAAHEPVAGTATIRNYVAGNWVNLRVPTNTPTRVTLHARRWGETVICPTGTVSAPGYLDQPIDFDFPEICN